MPLASTVRDRPAGAADHRRGLSVDVAHRGLQAGERRLQPGRRARPLASARRRSADQPANSSGPSHKRGEPLNRRGGVGPRTGSSRPSARPAAVRNGRSPSSPRPRPPRRLSLAEMGDLGSGAKAPPVPGPAGPAPGSVGQGRTGLGVAGVDGDRLIGSGPSLFRGHGRRHLSMPSIRALSGSKNTAVGHGDRQGAAIRHPCRAGRPGRIATQSRRPFMRQAALDQGQARSSGRNWGSSSLEVTWPSIGTPGGAGNLRRGDQVGRPSSQHHGRGRRWSASRQACFLSSRRWHVRRGSARRLPREVLLLLETAQDIPRSCGVTVRRCPCPTRSSPSRRAGHAWPRWP